MGNTSLSHGLGRYSEAGGSFLLQKEKWIKFQNAEKFIFSACGGGGGGFPFYKKVFNCKKITSSSEADFQDTFLDRGLKIIVLWFWDSSWVFRKPLENYRKTCREIESKLLSFWKILHGAFALFASFFTFSLFFYTSAEFPENTPSLATQMIWGHDCDGNYKEVNYNHSLK